MSVTSFGRLVSYFILSILILTCTALAATPIVTITSPGAEFHSGHRGYALARVLSTLNAELGTLLQ